MQERFGLHDLAVEDAQTFHLRPKVEQYEDDERVLFVVLHRRATTTSARRSTSARSPCSSPSAS